jgi:hypothetical protein|eukprot:COSAG05_NODE_7291_length_832_cov_1.241473_1_plen_96_part_00
MCCLEEGGLLGDPSEERINRSTVLDFLTFFEAWFLQRETFGEFANQSAKNALQAAIGCFLDIARRTSTRRLPAVCNIDDLQAKGEERAMIIRCFY